MLNTKIPRNLVLYYISFTKKQNVEKIDFHLFTVIIITFDAKAYCRYCKINIININFNDR